MTKTLNLCLKFDFLRLSLAFQYKSRIPVPETGTGRLHPFSHLSGFLHLLQWRPIFSLLQCPVLPEESKDLHTQSLIINNSLTYTFVEHISISFFSIYMKHISLPCCASYNSSKFLHLLNIFCIYNYFSILSSKLSTSNIYAINDENFLTSITVIQIGKLFPFVVFH